jgi:hypothetical protein
LDSQLASNRVLIHRKLGLELGNILPLTICLDGLKVCTLWSKGVYRKHLRRVHHCSVPEVIVEIPELAHRFRETPQTIKDALRLLRDIGRAEPADLDGCWKLQLAGTLPSGREGFHSATRHSHT